MTDIESEVGVVRWEYSTESLSDMHPEAKALWLYDALTEIDLAAVDGDFWLANSYARRTTTDPERLTRLDLEHERKIGQYRDQGKMLKIEALDRVARRLLDLPPAQIMGGLDDFRNEREQAVKVTGQFI